MTVLALHSRSAIQTEELGRRLGPLLEPGMFVALRGELGGGKTCFTRGVVDAVAPESARLVASPTFAIMNEYPGATPVYHFDFYRLSTPHEIEELGFEEYFHGDGICIAEWPERLGGLIPGDHLCVTFTHAGDDGRAITMEAGGPRAEKLLNRFADLAADAEKML